MPLGNLETLMRTSMGMVRLIFWILESLGMPLVVHLDLRAAYHDACEMRDCTWLTPVQLFELKVTESCVYTPTIAYAIRRQREKEPLQLPDSQHRRVER
jgi:hypothetical protein